MKHRRCPHKDGCLKYSFQVIWNKVLSIEFYFLKKELYPAQVLVQRFLYGWGIHTCLSLVLSVPMLVRKPSRLFSLLKQGKHVRFGAFLASLATIYRVGILCDLSFNITVNLFLFERLFIAFYVGYVVEMTRTIRFLPVYLQAPAFVSIRTRPLFSI